MYFSSQQNIAVYAACADPYSSDFGPEYLAFRAVFVSLEAKILVITVGSTTDQQYNFVHV